MSPVLDASAVIALLYEEPGREEVEAIIEQGATISAVNYSEVVAKMASDGWDDDLIERRLQPLALHVADFDRAQAVDAGHLRRQTRSAGLSLGDRCCLALAARKDEAAVTAERIWSRLALDHPIDVVLIR